MIAWRRRNPEPSLTFYSSCAQWPPEVYTDANGNNVTFDDHSNYDRAAAVCDRLKREGFGGEGKHFPIRTWVTETRE